MPNKLPLAKTEVVALGDPPANAVPAKDVPSEYTLRERPDAVYQKKKWLMRHDRGCGDLYGMLPLIEGMPVMLTDHVVRNPEKCYCVEE